MSIADWNPNDSGQLTADIEIRNYNLCINKDDFDLFMFCFHPQIGKKGATSYEVKKNSTVMAISIVEKMKNVVDTITNIGLGTPMEQQKKLHFQIHGLREATVN